MSSHYLGEKGEDYFKNRLNDPDDFGYELNANFYLPYIKPGQDVLDFGCGGGKLMEKIANKVSANIEGYEINPVAVAASEKRGFDVYSNFDALPSNKKYDVIYSNHVLEHISDVVATMKQVKGLLKKGGVFVTMLPIDDFRSSNQRSFQPNDIDFHLHSWTPRQFANVLYSAGFSVQNCKVVTSAWHPKLFSLIKLFPPTQYIISALLKRRQLFALAMNE